jgi:hypothetical protein
MVFEMPSSKIAKILANAGIPYMVIGGQAVLVYGEPRMTRDMADAKTIVLRQQKLDDIHVEKWLKEFPQTLGRDFVALFRSLKGN